MYKDHPKVVIMLLHNLHYQRSLVRRSYWLFRDLMSASSERECMIQLQQWLVQHK